MRSETAAVNSAGADSPPAVAVSSAVADSPLVAAVNNAAPPNAAVRPSEGATSRRADRLPVLRVEQLRPLGQWIAVRDKPVGNKLKMRHRPKHGVVEAARPAGRQRSRSKTSAVISQSSPAIPMRRTLTVDLTAGWATTPVGMITTTT